MTNVGLGAMDFGEMDIIVGECVLAISYRVWRWSAAKKGGSP